MHSSSPFRVPEPPLAVAIAEHRRATERCTAVAALAVGAALAFAAGVEAAVWVLPSAAVVAVGLGVHLRARAAARTHQVLRVLARGGDHALPPLVARTRDRLASERSRIATARTLEGLADARGRGRALAPPPGAAAFPGRAARELGADLRMLAAWISRGEPGVAGLAQAELLIADAGSVLYGHDAGALRQELARLRFRLASGQCSDSRH
jgi:hypothetical protein